MDLASQVCEGPGPGWLGLAGWLWFGLAWAQGARPQWALGPGPLGPVGPWAHVGLYWAPGPQKTKKNVVLNQVGLGQK